METIVNGYFDEIELWDTAYFGNPIITDTAIIIPTRNITLFEGHPLNKTGKTLILPEGKLCFSDVTKSERDIAEYIGEPKSGKGFKPAYKIIDGPFTKVEQPVINFWVEGIWENPPAWITWEIESGLFWLEIPEISQHTGLLAEIIEDIALEKAIVEGENTEPASREAIFKVLEQQQSILKSGNSV